MASDPSPTRYDAGIRGFGVLVGVAALLVVAYVARHSDPELMSRDLTGAAMTAFALVAGLAAESILRAPRARTAIPGSWTRAFLATIAVAAVAGIAIPYFRLTGIPPVSWRMRFGNDWWLGVAIELGALALVSGIVWAWRSLRRTAPPAGPSGPKPPP